MPDFQVQETGGQCGPRFVNDNMLFNQILLTMNFFLKVFVYSEHNDKRGVHICNRRKEEAFYYSHLSYDGKDMAPFLDFHAAKNWLLQLKDINVL